MSTFLYRVFLTIVNIFFPPVAVLMVCGASQDFIINCGLFLLAVIPSHIHGFYITCVYFHRRSKVKKGIHPGGPKSMIYSKRVLNGGASDQELMGLRRKGKAGKTQDVAERTETV